MCPTERETVPVAGPSDQQDSERYTILCLKSFCGEGGAGREVVNPVNHPRHMHSCPCHEREDVAAVPVMINCFEMSLFMYLLLLLSCIKYAINWH